MQQTEITLEAKQAAIEWDRTRDKDHDNFPSILDAFAYGYEARTGKQQAVDQQETVQLCTCGKGFVDVHCSVHGHL